MARDNIGMNDPTARNEQPRNPLHGVTLEAMVRALEAHFGWEELARQIPVRCFSHDPSVGSSLKFLRKTPWARMRCCNINGPFRAMIEIIALQFRPQ